MKPFLLKVFGSQVGGVNGPMIDAQVQNEQNKSDQNLMRDSIQQNDEERANILRDIEKIINNLEAKQSRQTETVLQTIETYFENIARKSGSTSRASGTSRSRTTSMERINKSSMSPVAPVQENNNEIVQNNVQENHDNVINKTDNITLNEIIQQSNEDSNENSPDSQQENDSPAITASIDYGGSIIELILEEPSDRETSAEYDNNLVTEINTSASPTLTLSNESTANESSLSPTPLSTRTPSRRSTKYRGPKFLIGRSFSKVSTARLNDRRKIRELEKELKRQMKMASEKPQESRPESQMTGFISDSTLVADDDRSMITPIPLETLMNDNERTFSMTITHQPSIEALEVDQLMGPIDLQQPSTSKDAKNRDLSKMMQDTKQLIQQMKNEIDEDIAMSDFGGEDDKDDTEYFENNRDYSENDDYEEDLSEETINENDFDSSDGWIDIDDEDLDENGEIIYENLRSNNDSRRSSMESDHFVEAHEELTPSMMQNDSIYLDDGDNNSLEHFELNDEINEIEEKSQNIKTTELIQPSEATTTNPNMDAVDESKLFEMNTIESITPIDILSNALPTNSQEFLESVIKIQNSLHSSVVALNVIEMQAESEERELPQLNVANVTENENQISIAHKSETSTTEISNEQIVPDEFSESVNSIQPEISNETLEVNAEPNISSSNVMNDKVITKIENNENVPSIDNIYTEAAVSTEIIVINTGNIVNTTALEIEIPSIDVQPIIMQENIERTQTIQDDLISIATEASSSDTGASDVTVIQVTEGLVLINHDAEENETDEEVSEIVDENSQSQNISDSEENPNRKTNEINQNNESFVQIGIKHIDHTQQMKQTAIGTTTNPSSVTDIEEDVPQSNEQPQTSEEILVESYKYEKYTIPVITECSQSSINLMQLKKIENTNATTKNKIPVRRLSLTGASSSVRQLQNELLNKQSSPPKSKPIGRRPSKIVPPKLFFKEGVPAGSNKPEPIPSTSKQANASSRELPKKKYYETCFSDDYQTSDDEKPSTNTRVIPNLINIVEDSFENKEPEEIVKKLLDDGSVTNLYDAVLVSELIQLKFDQKDALSVVGQCSNVEQAIAFLQQECELCTETYPMNKIVSMLKCTHSCCIDCAKNYFTIQVRNSNETSRKDDNNSSL